MRILGIDPGTAIVGWAVLDNDTGDDVPVAYGHIETSPNNSVSHRLKEVADDLRKIINKYEPKEAAVEDIFFFKNQKTAVKVSQSRGAILLTLEDMNVKIAEYTPLQVKQSLTGYGRAEKKQIQIMVKSVLGLKEIPKPDDVADAIAIAMCRSSRKLEEMIEKSE